MQMIRRVVVLVAVALVAVGCGSGEGAPDVTAGEQLGAALDSAVASDSYVLEVFAAEEISSPVLGIESSTEIDRDSPTTRMMVTSEGQHAVFDLSGMFGGSLELDDELGFEMWTTDDETVMDTSSYSALAELNPAADLGPYEPGVFTFDMARVGEVEGVDAADMLGVSAFDLESLAADLPAALEGVLEDPDNPGRFVGTGTVADVMEATGGDIETTASSMAAGIALNLGIDAEALAALYLEFFEGAETEVVVTVVDGRLSELEYDNDLSGLYTLMFEPDTATALFGEVPDGELETASAAFADTDWVQHNLIVYTPAPDLVIERAPTPTEDRTDEMIEFFEASGAFG